MTTQTTRTATTYFPGPGADWERRSPDHVGMDPDLLQRAIDYSNETHREGHLRDLAEQIRRNNAGKQHDNGETLGPTKTRGAVTGVVLRHGYLVAEWGEPERVDMTFSVTKSFLSTVAGLAYDRGLIRDVHDPVADYVDDGGYDSPHNAKITWDHSLRQISEWDGTLWDKHYAAGNHEDLYRPVEEPGTAYEYNDVRVNRFSLSLLRVWKRPLPEVLKQHVMDPIDASDTWKWNGYRNSYVDVDGQRMWSVSGGGHWGGGMWISARDQARFGLLSLRRGEWNGNQLLSREWVDMATTPTPIQPTYGFMNWFLNTDRALMPSVPETSFYHLGAGANKIWVDPDHDLVVVLRWVATEHFDGFAKRVLASLK